jgi:hypothetical protein
MVGKSHAMLDVSVITFLSVGLNRFFDLEGRRNGLEQAAYRPLGKGTLVEEGEAHNEERRVPFMIHAMRVDRSGVEKRNLVIDGRKSKEVLGPNLVRDRALDGKAPDAEIPNGHRRSACFGLTVQLSHDLHARMLTAGPVDHGSSGRCHFLAHRASSGLLRLC